MLLAEHGKLGLEAQEELLFRWKNGLAKTISAAIARLK